MADAGFERDSGYVMAFVDDDKAVSMEQFGRPFAAGDALDHGDIDDSGLHVLAASDCPDLTGFESEVFLEAVTPLLEERLAIDKDQCWTVMMGDDGTGHDRLAGSGRGNDDASIVRHDRVDRGCLLWPKRTDELDTDCRVFRPGISNVEAAGETGDEVGDLFDETTR